MNNKKTINKIVALCIKGNNKAQNELYTLCKTKLYTMCLKFSNNSNQADDMFIEGFTKILMNLQNWTDNYTFFTWAGTIMKNNCINICNKRYNKHEQTFEVLPEPQQYHSEPRFDMTEIKYFINKLPKKEKLVFTLVFVNDMPYEKVAEKLKLDNCHCRVICFRAKQKLKQYLTQYEKLSK